MRTRGAALKNRVLGWDMVPSVVSICRTAESVAAEPAHRNTPGLRLYERKLAILCYSCKECLNEHLRSS